MERRLQSIVRVIMTVIGGGVGAGIYLLIANFAIELGSDFFTGRKWLPFMIAVIFALIFAIIFFFISPWMAKRIYRFEQKLKSMPAKDVAFGVLGLVVGLFIAYLLSRLVALIPMSWLTVPISVLLYLVLGYTGVSVAINKREDLIVSLFHREGSSMQADGVPLGSPKILDTSVIIDGRIFDIANTGFLEGPLYIPAFVLMELRYIADSGDELKRNRGRRGLDILKRMQEELNTPVQVYDKDYDDPTADVDSKLLRLAAEINAAVVTNDYNLNKVAGVQGVRVLNINELSNAVKPIALPGEVMEVRIVKEGREQQQGVGFLADGTMIVVQDAGHLIGETLHVEVTTALQTAAGRMIFARIK